MCVFVDVSSEAFVSVMHDSTPEQRSLSSSIDELDEDSPKSSPNSAQDSEPQRRLRPKAWPSCPDLSIQENIWQMRHPDIERRKRPSSSHQMRYSTNSPRSSVYSPRSSGYWSELEQLSESETLSPTHKQPAESPSPLSQEKTFNESPSAETQNTAEPEGPETTSMSAWQRTRGVFNQWRFKGNRTRSSECLSRDSDSFRGKTIQRINSMPVERHTRKISENNKERKTFMTDV